MSTSAPQFQLPNELGTSERDEDEPPRALVLEGTHQALDDRDAAKHADGPEAVLDAQASALALEALCCELDSLNRQPPYPPPVSAN